MYFNEKHRQRVINRGDNYEYIGSYKLNETTIDKKKSKMHIRVRCPYCGKEYDVRLDQFDNASKCSYCCNEYENSFAYHIEVELGERLEDYWDFEENSRLGINPWNIYKSSTDKIYIWCQDKWYHGSYCVIANKFTSKGTRCCFCKGNKIHRQDSFGYLYPEKIKYWSSNNDKSPYEVRPKSHDEHKFICEECGEEFERRLDNLNRFDKVICNDCNNSQLEEITKRILQKYNIEYISQKEYKGLLGLGGGNLSYDFYLPQYNTLIECQGIQHKKWIEGWITKEGFERQLEHDRRKKQYAIDHNINFLEIWYYDIDNIEEILIKQLNL